MLQPVVAVYAKPYGQSGRRGRPLDWGRWIVELTLGCTHAIRWEWTGARGMALHQPGPSNAVKFKRARALPFADCLACGPGSAPVLLSRKEAALVRAVYPDLVP